MSHHDDFAPRGDDAYGPGGDDPSGPAPAAGRPDPGYAPGAGDGYAAGGYAQAPVPGAGWGAQAQHQAQAHDGAGGFGAPGGQADGWGAGSGSVPPGDGQGAAYGGGYAPGPGQVPGAPGGSGPWPGPGGHDGFGSGHGVPDGAGYAAPPAGGYGQVPGYQEAYGAPYGGAAPDGAYVPEPLAGPMPGHADPGAAYGPPTGADAWGGHAATADAAYGGPVSGDGWAGAPAGAHPWQGPPAEPPAAAWSSPPHAYAAPQPAPEAAAYEDTAVLPVVEEPQPAPRRTGSPIIAPGLQPAGLTAALGLLMAGGAALGKPGLAVFLVALQAVTAAGWFRLNGMWPARQGIVLAFAAGVTADIGLFAAGGDHAPAVLAGTLGVWLLFVLVLQLRHRGSPDERLASLTATSASTLLTVLAAGYLAVAAGDAGADPVVVGAVAVAVATVVRALPLPGGPLSVAVSLLAGAVSGLVTGPATGFGGAAIALAAACGGCALIGLRVASYDFPSRFVHFTAGVALPLTAAAPVVYALGRALAG